MKYRMIPALTLVMAVLFFGCTKNEDGAQAGAPNFTLEDLNGKSVKLADFKGQVVLLDFWATWCPPCRASVPGLESLHRAYANKGLVILAVSLDQGEWDAVKSFQTEYGITYTILKGNEDVSTQYMVRSIPLLVIVDRDGKVRKRLIGYGNEEVLAKDIQALL